MNSLKIATLNIAGLTDLGKRATLKNFLTGGGVGIACVQEVSFTSCSFLEKDFRMIVNTGPTKRGTAVLLRRDLRIENVYFEPDGRLTSVDLRHSTVISVYAPAGTRLRKEREEFFNQTVTAYLAKCKNPAILMGDFNCVEVDVDRKQHQRGSRQRTAVSNALINLVKGLSLVDIWKSLKHGDPGFTFHCSTCSKA